MTKRRRKLSTKQIAYRRYLRSKKWARKRVKVMKRFNYTCAKCGAKNARFNVHHLTYKHIYNERIYELILLCESCHNAIHITMQKREHNKIINALLAANKLNKSLVIRLLKML